MDTADKYAKHSARPGDDHAANPTTRQRADCAGHTPKS